jgi:phage virion morphogenesis protein
MQINITSNLAQVQQQLQLLQDKGQNLAPAMATIATEVLQVAEDAIDDETSPWGQPWQPLTAATLKYKKNQSGNILEESGALKQGLFIEHTNDSATIGTNVRSDSGYPYPAVHQFGSDNVPARAFLPFNDQGDDIPAELRADILEILTDHFT